jgi:hypothetical protein
LVLPRSGCRFQLLEAEKFYKNGKSQNCAFLEADFSSPCAILFPRSMRPASRSLVSAFRRLWLAFLLAFALARAGDAPAAIRTLADPTAATQLIQQQTLATVILFTDTECPISNKYAPEVRRLAKKFQQARFWLAYPHPGTTPAQIAAHLKAYDYPCGAVRDPEHHLVRLSGAKVTPEAAVFQGGKLVYRGRVDDRFPALGVQRPEATARDLEAVLEEIAQGKNPAFRSTRAVGCSIATP